MSWFKVDDQFGDHPKTLACPRSAVGLWVLAGAWSCRQLTDGAVPQAWVDRQGDGANEDAARLVAAGLWDKTDVGFQFHDWADFQPSAHSVREKRAKDRERKQRGRDAEMRRTNGRFLARSTRSPRGIAADSAKVPPVPNPNPNQESTQDEEPIGSSSSENRPELRALCEHLADRIEANGSKRPTIGKKWLDSARLLIDRDHRTPEQVRRCIDWCQEDEFWRGNILSMPTLRAKYDQLRLAAARKDEQRSAPRLTLSEQIYTRERQRLQAEQSPQAQFQIGGSA